MTDINNIMKPLEAPILDIRYLIDRKYPKKSVITYVSNHYGLTKDERYILTRITCEKNISNDRKRKLVPIQGIEDRTLLIDGYNVLITIESMILGYPVFLCDDGMLKDARSLFHKYKINPTTKKALSMIETITSMYDPKKTIIIFDSQISRSGDLSKMTRDIFDENNCLVFTSKDTDKELIKNSKKSKKAVTATSDGVIIDNVENVLDIPIHIAGEFKYNFYIPTEIRY